jgi:hypothetical protein
MGAAGVVQRCIIAGLANAIHYKKDTGFQIMHTSRQQATSPGPTPEFTKHAAVLIRNTAVSQ